MKIITVTYTTRTEFSEQNKINILSVMRDLQKLNRSGIRYTACLTADGKTFVHTAFFESDSDRLILNDLPSFRYFQEQLKVSGCEVPPKQEVQTLVGASHSIFETNPSIL